MNRLFGNLIRPDRRRQIVTLLVASLYFVGGALADLPARTLDGTNSIHAELFKLFAAGQVPIADLTCRFELHDSGGNASVDQTTYLRFRLQSNALLFAESRSPVHRHLDLRNSMIVSRFDDTFWYNYYGDLYVWRKGTDIGDGNVVDRNFSRALSGGIARILNGGCDSIPAFRIKWSDDSFSETNYSSGFVVSGRLEKDEMSRAKSLSVTLQRVDKATSMSYVIDYEYDQSSPYPHLPKKVIKGPLVGAPAGKPNFAWELTFTDIHLAGSSMGEDQFSLTPGTTNANYVFAVSNGNLIYTSGGSVLVAPDTQSASSIAKTSALMAKGRSRRTCVRIAMALLCLLAITYLWKQWSRCPN